MGILSVRQTNLQAWECKWLRIPAPIRQILRTVCAEPENPENPRVLKDGGVNGDSEPCAPCFFSTPERMRDCIPGPQAHIFQCKIELRLGGGKLVFVSPWQTRVEIPLRDIHNLSIGLHQASRFARSGRSAAARFHHRVVRIAGVWNRRAGGFGCGGTGESSPNLDVLGGESISAVD